VRKFTPGGELLLTLGTAGVPSDTGYDKTRKTQYEKNASIVRGAPPFHRPTRIAVAANGEMYVADGYGNARVHRFAADGTLLQSWGNPGTGPGQFLVPHGIAVAADGRVLVADRENDRIQVFTADGEYLNEWQGLSRPTSLFIDRSQSVYITETGWAFDPEGSFDSALPIRVSVFDLQGNLLARWENVEGSDLGAFAAPHGICVDSQGSIYLASNNRRDRAESSPPADDSKLVDYSLQKFSRVT
jgi:DNA-binding beta-propeller fold protein YncE